MLIVNVLWEDFCSAMPQLSWQYRPQRFGLCGSSGAWTSNRRSTDPTLNLLLPGACQEIGPEVLSDLINVLARPAYFCSESSRSGEGDL
jgi:hypothetical protein